MEPINPELLLSDLYFDAGFDYSARMSRRDWELQLKAIEWTPRQAALLLVGVKSNKFNSVDDGELLTDFLGTIPNLTQSPADWLRLFNEKGYLAHAEKWLLVEFEKLAAKAEIVVDVGAVEYAELKSTTPNERELKQGLREIWIKEGKPEMKAFFPALKKYIHQKGSPITAVYTAGKKAGISFELSTGTTGDRTKKTISNYIATFKNPPQ